jgi:predicted AlkP superfamily phosphohydrolase/phosphomutase
VPNGLAVSGIRLNLAGREPQGTVRPGADAENLFQDLARDLLDIQRESTHAPLVRRVLRTAELYQGPNLDCLPDILVEWQDGAASGSTALGSGAGAIVRASSPRIGVVEAMNGYGRTGEHRADGLMIAAGPAIAPRDDDLSVSIFDVAPTIAAALGVDLDAVEGRAEAAMIPVADARSMAR